MPHAPGSIPAATFASLFSYQNNTRTVTKNGYGYIESEKKLPLREMRIPESGVGMFC
jgi:hypothetical protein